MVVGCLSLGSVRDKSHFDFRELQSDPYEEIYSFIWEEFHERTSLRNGLAGRCQSCFRFPIPSHHPTIPHRSRKCCSWRPKHPKPKMDTSGTRILANLTWQTAVTAVQIWYHDISKTSRQSKNVKRQRFRTFLEAVTMFELMLGHLSGKTRNLRQKDVMWLKDLGPNLIDSLDLCKAVAPWDARAGGKMEQSTRTALKR